MNAHIIDHTPKHPKVSIIMLVYNSAAFLPYSISSILRQKTSFDIQLVLSDDCSTDSDTIEICKLYAAAFPDKIALITHERNQGIPRNFIDAYNACKGQYIAMCDADDYWCCRDKLNIMVRYMDRHPCCAVAFHRVINYYEDNGTKSLSNGAQRKLDYTLSDLCAGNFITNCSVLYRRSACDAIPDSVADILLCDYATHMLHALSGYIHYFSRPMAVYRKRSDALWTGVKATQRYHDALAVRQFGLQLLKHDSTAKEYGIMVQNFSRNAISCLAAAQAEGIKMDFVTKQLRRLHPDWNDEVISNKIAEYISHTTTKTTLPRKIASTLRALLSRMIPIPKITPLLRP